VFAGQVDRADASHMTMRFELDGKTGWIEGRLGDDDVMVLTVLEPPGVQTASR
jgi:hypothetical protein